jgi:hypothetical protein
VARLAQSEPPLAQTLEREQMAPTRKTELLFHHQSTGHGSTPERGACLWHAVSNRATCSIRIINDVFVAVPSPRASGPADGPQSQMVLIKGKLGQFKVMWPCLRRLASRSGGASEQEDRPRKAPASNEKLDHRTLWDMESQRLTLWPEGAGSPHLVDEGNSVQDDGCQMMPILGGPVIPEGHGQRPTASKRFWVFRKYEHCFAITGRRIDDFCFLSSPGGQKNSFRDWPCLPSTDPKVIQIGWPLGSFGIGAVGNGQRPQCHAGLPETRPHRLVL